MTNKDLTTIINLNTNANSEETRMWVILILAVIATESEDTWLIMRFLLWLIAFTQTIIFWMSRKALKVVTDELIAEEREEEADYGE